jgi:hypothetical protein
MFMLARKNWSIPGQTARVARAIYPDGNQVMRMLDVLHLAVVDSDYADLFPAHDQPAEFPARLAQHKTCTMAKQVRLAFGTLVHSQQALAAAFAYREHEVTSDEDVHFANADLARGVELQHVHDHDSVSPYSSTFGRW